MKGELRVTPLYASEAATDALEAFGRLADFLDFEERWCLAMRLSRTDEQFYEGRLTLIRNVRKHMEIIPTPPVEGAER